MLLRPRNKNFVAALLIQSDSLFEQRCRAIKVASYQRRGPQVQARCRAMSDVTKRLTHIERLLQCADRILASSLGQRGNAYAGERIAYTQGIA